MKNISFKEYCERKQLWEDNLIENEPQGWEPCELFDEEQGDVCGCCGKQSKEMFFRADKKCPSTGDYFCKECKEREENNE